MKLRGNIRKMKTRLNGIAEYSLPLYDVLAENHLLPLNELLGSRIKITFDDEIHCVVTGKKIKKTYGEGMSYDAFVSSPQASPSIINPELSRIHEGIALRDYDWEMEHHMKPHYVYLSNTSNLKVGVTRVSQVPTRWIDQGASQALVIAETPYRQAAGLIEINLKNFLKDKTNWQQMLKAEPEYIDLENEKKIVLEKLSEELKIYTNIYIPETLIKYPILKYPEKIKSIKLDSEKEIDAVLSGIKGQYLIFDNSKVLNIRSHTGYKISIEF